MFMIFNLGANYLLNFNFKHLPFIFLAKSVFPDAF